MLVLQVLCELLASAVVDNTALCFAQLLVAAAMVDNTALCCAQLLVWKKLGIAFYVYLKLLGH